MINLEKLEDNTLYFLYDVSNSVLYFTNDNQLRINKAEELESKSNLIFSRYTDGWNFDDAVKDFFNFHFPEKRYCMYGPERIDL